MSRALEADSKLARAGRRMAAGEGMSSAVRQAISGIALVTVVLVGASAVRSGQMPGVDLAAVALLALAAFDPIGPLATGFATADEDLESGRRLTGLTDLPAPVEEPASAQSWPSGPVSVSLEGIGVLYGQRAALDGLDLDLPAGATVGLVGPSGSGKTTVAHVLARFVDPSRGSYRINGVNARSLSSDEIRTHVVLVPQDVHVFNASLRKNLLLGRPEATDEDLLGVLARVGLSGLLAGLPEGLDAPMGEPGDQLSGGERRRVGLARALLRHPDVLILDEPTAHLDRDNAVRLMRDALASAQGCTLLVITHEVEDLEGFDRIVEVRCGRVAV